MAGELKAAQEALLDATIRQHYRNNTTSWFKRFAVFRDKQGSLQKFNPETGIGPRPTVVQQKMFSAYDDCQAKRIPCKMIVLKPRQDGASTGAQVILYRHLRKYTGRKGCLMGDIQSTGDKIFEHFRMFAENDEFDWGDGFGRITKENSQVDDIVLPGGSQYIKVTAGSTNAGRGGTAQAINMSEVGFYTPNPDRDPALAFLGSWAKEGETSLGIMDSTPNGLGNTFANYWFDDNGWIKIFVAWWEEPTHIINFRDEDHRREFISQMDEDEREEQSKYNVTLEQMAWRRQRIHDDCGGDPDKFRQEYPSSDTDSFLRKARSRFSISVLEKIEQSASVQRPERGSLSENNNAVTFYPDEGGNIFIYEHPRINCKYLIAFDSCTGRDQHTGGKRSDPDEHSIKVWRAEYVEPGGNYWPPKLVACHASQLEAETAVQICAWLSTYYGHCIVFPEVNGCGLYPTKKLIELGVPVFYRKSANSSTGTMDGAAGWDTNASTRMTIIDHLGALISRWRPEAPTFHNFDLPTIQQYKKFVRKKNGRCEAMDGEHDDRVMADAIALYNLSAATLMQEPRRKPTDIRKLMQREGWKLMGR